MKNNILLICLCIVLFSLNSEAQINQIAGTWNVPNLTTNASDMGMVNGSGYNFIDINGDGYADLIDAQDNTSFSSVWTNGLQRYWKVYLNDGTSISPTATNWNVPNLTTNASDMGTVNDYGYSFVDINGDGLPDLIDAQDNTSFSSVWTNGSQRYWKVYLNNGTSISSTATNWDVPNLTTNASDMGTVNGSGFSFIDVNGDGFADLIDAQDNTSFSSVWTSGSQRYWKVYLNDGTSISPTATNWNVPNLTTNASNMGMVNSTGYSFIDINGDDLPDLIDAHDNTSFSSVWTNGPQRYWKVYLNDGTSISPTATNWDVPNLTTNASDMGTVNGSGYNFMDVNADGFADLIDALDNTSFTSVWTNGSQRYWKIYLNNGTSISPNATNWDVPNLTTSAGDMGSVNGFGYSFLDINGDMLPDLIDAHDNTSFTSVWTSAAQRYWKIYYNEYITLVNTITVNGSGGLSNVNSGNNLQMEAEILPLNAVDQTYTWTVEFGTGTGSISSTGVLTGLNPGTVVVRATANDASGTSGVKVITVILGTSIFNIENELEFSISPNPTTDLLNLDFGITLLNATVRIFDIRGTVIHEASDLNGNYYTFDLSTYSSGIYFIGISTDNGFSRAKFIKE